MWAFGENEVAGLTEMDVESRHSALKGLPVSLRPTSVQKRANAM
jgi:hypothetical protein